MATYITEEKQTCNNSNSPTGKCQGWKSIEHTWLIDTYLVYTDMFLHILYIIYINTVTLRNVTL